MKKQKGITLIALIITIIVMLILVAVSVNIATNGGIFTKARKAAFQTDVRKYQEELQAYLVTNYEDIAEIRNGKLEVASEKLKTTCIPSYNEEKYGKKFMVSENKLKYLYNNEKEEEWARECGVELQSTDSKITINIEGKGKVKVTGEIKASTESKEIKPEIECTEKTEFIATAYKTYELTAIEEEKDINGNDVEFVFSRWLKDGETISTNATETITVTEPVTYTAVFEPSETLIYYNENDVFVTAETTINASTYSGTITDNTSIKKVLFGNKVTAIGNSAFSGCTGIKTVSFSNSIETIGGEAFRGCTNITGEITLPNKVTTLNNSTFSGCTGITKVNLSNVTSISGSCFQSCSSIEELIGEKVTYVASYIIQNDSKLTKVTLGSINNPVNTINKYSFANTGKETIKVYIDTKNGTVTSLENEPWEASNATIEYYDASNGKCVNVILGTKYQGNLEITWEEIPNKDKIITIRNNAFQGCTNITGEITLPDKVTTLSKSTFSGCTGLIKVNLNNVTSIDSATFYSCNNIEELIGEKVKYVASYIIQNDSKLTKVTLGSINNPVNTIDKYAFSNTGNEIIKVYIDTQNETVTSLANEPWGANNATIEYYDAKTGNKIN